MGAPPGGRVHWLLMWLDPAFARAYRLYYDYVDHNYHFVRYCEKRIIDEFTVIRTSRRCFRVMFFSWEFNYFEYFSCRTSRACASELYRVYMKMLRAEEIRRLRGDKSNTDNYS